MLFRILSFSSSTAFVQSRRTILAHCYLAYVKFILRHSLSYDKLHHKNRRPEWKIGAAVLLCKASQIFFHVLILNTVYLLASPAIVKAADTRQNASFAVRTAKAEEVEPLE